jgi:hypothetical protein
VTLLVQSLATGGSRDALVQSLAPGGSRDALVQSLAPGGSCAGLRTLTIFYGSSPDF